MRKYENKSHNNSGLMTLNRLNTKQQKHSSFIEDKNNEITKHFILIGDSINYLKKIPANSIQLILIDPPYNLEMDFWDSYSHYIDWAKKWLDEVYRILSPSGSFVVFGGFQFQDLKKGDLLEILYYIRHHTELRLINVIIWHYKNGMSAFR